MARYIDPESGLGGGTWYYETYIADCSAEIYGAILTTGETTPPGYVLSKDSSLKNGDIYLVSRGDTYGKKLVTVTIDSDTGQVTLTSGDATYEVPLGKPNVDGKVLASKANGERYWAPGLADIAKPTVTGSKSSNTALASLINALAAYGIIVDSTT